MQRNRPSLYRDESTSDSGSDVEGAGHGEGAGLLSGRRPSSRRRPSAALKFFVFCSAMIVFSVLLYIPVYNRANVTSIAIVPGWTSHTNRDTKVYVQPENVTIIHEPTNVCANSERNDPNEKVFLVIIVHSATNNFKSRNIIRNTYAEYENYVILSKLFKEAKEPYKTYDYSYDLYQPNVTVSVNDTATNSEVVDKTQLEAVARPNAIHDDRISKIKFKSKQKRFTSQYNDDSFSINISNESEQTNNDRTNDADNNKNKTLVVSKKNIYNKKLEVKSRKTRSFNQLLPKIAEAIQKNLEAENNHKHKEEQNQEEKRFDDSGELEIPQFDMQKELAGDKTEAINEYDNYEESHVMQIPRKGYEETPSLDEIVNVLKNNRLYNSKIISLNDYVDRQKNSSSIADIEPLKDGENLFVDRLKNGNQLQVKVTDVKTEQTKEGANIYEDAGATLDLDEIYKVNEDELNEAKKLYKVVFLLGVPANDSDAQDKIDEESEQYGDIIQENFVDMYNNLTVKSIMMLKWVTNSCSESVRYVLKTDDDVLVNVPNVIGTLRERAERFDRGDGRTGSKEYMLIGDLIAGAKPVSDTTSKWFAPRYMFDGKVYPRYLSGTGYVMSQPTAVALYAAALTTPLFHLEDIYITGMCSVRAQPRVRAQDAPGFSYVRRACPLDACALYAAATTHAQRLACAPPALRALASPDRLDVCERRRLTEVRHERLRRARISRARPTRP